MTSNPFAPAVSVNLYTMLWGQRRPSIDFYLSLGAKPMNDWTIYRLDAKALRHLAEGLGLER